MRLAPGHRLGPYEILTLIGVGGMGEVYRARDTRLGRDIALKVLPANVADDPTRRQRFETEARVVAALNHPNIVALHDVGTEGGVSYIVTELVDGEPLPSGKFGQHKAVEIAMQIASGLAAAHDAGITHRDLKRGNILITRHGQVKILDFGLAKLRAAHSTGGSETITVGTEPGVVIGTIGYMAPEQVRSLEADPRSDIFSFGVILYELVAGQRPFQGETSVDTMQAILRQDPSELPASVPDAMRRIIAHCLEKDPSNRFQSARDLGFALAQIGTPTGTAAGLVPAARSWKMAVLLAVAVLAAVAAGIFSGWPLFRGAAASAWSAVILGGPEMALAPRLSPDGHLLAFLAMVDGQSQVAVMKPETGNWSVLTRDRTHGAATQISWSQDGSLIYYDRALDAPAGIFSVPVLGGEEHLVLGNAWYPEALADGSLLGFRLNAQRQYQIFRFWPEDGRSQEYRVQLGAQSTPLGRVQTAVRDKEAVIFGVPLGNYAEAPGFLAVDLASGTIRRLKAASAVRAWTVTRDGKSILAAVAAGALTRMVIIPMEGSVNERTLYTVTSDVWNLEAGPDGSVYVNMIDRPTDVVLLSLDGSPAERVGSFARVQRGELLAVLPDGRAVVPAGGSGHIRLMAVARGKDPVPLVNTAEETASPLAVVGTREIAFVIGPEPRQIIAIADVASGRVMRRLAPNKGAVVSIAASPDGKTVFFAASGRIWSIPAMGGEAKAIRPGDSVVVEPNGRDLIVRANESSRARLFRTTLDGSAEREIVLDGSNRLVPVWPLTPGAIHPDGRMLVSLLPTNSWFNPIGVLDLASGRITRTLADPQNDFHTMSWTADGKIMALKMALRAALWKFTPVGH